MPKLRAVSSPKAKASSTRASGQASSRHRVRAAAMSAHAGQPTRPVLPSMKPCMACKTWGCNKLSQLLRAPSTTPTITPASKSRKVCCTPRDRATVSSTAPKAPTKAAPVGPSGDCASDAPAPTRLSQIHTASVAPEALPSKKGSASGLRNSPCARAPARPNRAPASQAPTERGSRISRTICQAASSLQAWLSACQPVLPAPAPSSSPAAARLPSSTASQAGLTELVPKMLMVRLRAPLRHAAGTAPSAGRPRPCAGRGAPAPRLGPAQRRKPVRLARP